jgi:hypothetical protein
LSFLIDHILDGDAAARRTKGEQEAEQARRISRILEGQTEAGRRFVLDPSPYVSVRCPRRSGKSFAMASKAVYVGECKPNSRILVISLTLKSTKENYWAGAPSGIFRMDQMFDLGLRRHDTDLIWWHQNGSRGRLAGAETRSDIEYLRGAAAEADIVLLDECKSFAPQLLEELIRDVLEPGMMTRNGQIVMGGTPGLIPFGPFYDATSLDAHREDGTPTCALFGTRESVQVPVDVTSEEEAPDEPWSLHTWTVRDNTAAPGQWSRALRIKRRAGWDDTNPTWRREFLGDWVTDAQGLVYGFAGLRNDGDRVIWNPQRRADNPTGLPHEDGPWRLVLGIDFGYEDDFALVLAGYSEQLCELRHVYDFKSPHLVVDQMVEAICDVVDRFGAPDAMVGDAGGLGKALVETLNQTYALPVVKAEKHEKFDYIELLNSDFHSGRVKIIPGSDLDNELCGLQWDLSKGGKEQLVRSGKLREDRACPNHLCDALLYLWRYSYHHFSRPYDNGPTRGTPEWYRLREEQAEMQAAYGSVNRVTNTDGLGYDRSGLLTRETAEASSWLDRLSTYRN